MKKKLKTNNFDSLEVEEAEDLYVFKKKKNKY